MKICPQCYIEYQDNMKFCPECGSKLNSTDNSVNLNSVICECNDSSELCNDVYFAFANQYDVVKPLFRNWFVVGVTNKSKKGPWDDKYYEGIVDSNNNIIIPIQYWEILIYDNMLIATGKNALVMDLNANKLIDSEDIFIEKKKDFLFFLQGSKKQILRYEPFYSVSPNFYKAERLNDYLVKLFGCEDCDFDNEWEDKNSFRLFDRLNRDILGKNYYAIDEINRIYFLISDSYQSKKFGYDIAIEKNGHILVSEDMSLKLFPTKDGNIIFRKDYKYGLFDASFRTVISPKYDSLDFVGPGILKIGSQLINYKEERLVKSGNDYVVFSPKYERVWKITDDLFAACKYEEVEGEDGYKYIIVGLIDRSEQIILPFEYEGIGKFRLNDKTFIEINHDSKVGLVSIDGKSLLLDTKYNHIDSSYHNGEILHPYTTIWNQNGLDRLYGIINEDFKEILPPVHQILRFPSEGIITLMTNNLWGIYHVDKKSTQLIYDCTFLGSFMEGLCRINKGGMIKVSKEYDERYENDFYIDPNYNVYSEPEGGKWGFINTKGEIVIPIEYDSVGSFHEGLARVRIGEKWGFIDNNGLIVVSPQYKYVTIFSDGTATCYLEHESYGNYEIIDKKGAIIEEGYEQQKHNNSYGYENWYTQEELKDMYREAFDDNPNNYWGND